MTLRNRPPSIQILFAGTVLLLLVTPILREMGIGAGWRTPGYYDFRLYYEAGLALRSGVPLYQPPLNLLPDSATFFYYSPVFAALFVPFTYLDPTLAGHVFNSISILLLLASLYYLTNVVLESERRWVAGGVAIGVLFFYPSWPWIQNGQITGLVVASTAFGGGLLLKTRTRGGPFIAIAPAGKLFYLPTAAPLLWSRRALLRALAAGIVIGVVSVGIVGIDSFLNWLELISGGKGWSGQWRYIHTYLPLGFLGGYTIVAKLGLVAIAALVAFLARGQRGESQAWAFVLGCTTTALAVPAPLLYNAVIVFPAVIVAGALTYRSGSRYFGVVCLVLTAVHSQPLFFDLIIVYLAAARSINHHTVMIFLQPAQWGLLLLYGMSIERLWSATRGPEFSYSGFKARGARWIEKRGIKSQLKRIWSR